MELMASTRRKITVTDDPVDHVIRQVPPWREADLTECGRTLVEEKDNYITRNELIARAKELGAPRARLLTCMVCYDTAARHGTWASDPLAVIQRETGWSNKNKELFVRELRAIGALIEEHRAEFDDYVNGLADTVPLAELRRRRNGRNT
jgi:hypothetical protein